MSFSTKVFQQVLIPLLPTFRLINMAIIGKYFFVQVESCSSFLKFFFIYYLIHSADSFFEGWKVCSQPKYVGDRHWWDHWLHIYFYLFSLSDLLVGVFDELFLSEVFKAQHSLLHTLIHITPFSFKVPSVQHGQHREIQDCSNNEKGWLF